MTSPRATPEGPSLNAAPRLRCKRKNNCAVAWPESCPYWDRWACPVEPHEGQVPK